MKRISTVKPKSCGGVGLGYLRPDQFLDHLTVIIIELIKKILNLIAANMLPLSSVAPTNVDHCTVLVETIIFLI